MLTKLCYTATLLSLLLLSCLQQTTVLAPEYLYHRDQQHVISSVINDKKATISIIYGNELALQAARDTSRAHLEGEHYVRVTWKQKPMPHWYGTNMNGKILSVETVKVHADPAGKLNYAYQIISGSGAQGVENPRQRTQHIQYIISRQAAIVP